MRAVVGQPDSRGTRLRVKRGVLPAICLLGAVVAPVARAQLVEPHPATPHAVTPRVITAAPTPNAPAAPIVPTSASDAPALPAETTRWRADRAGGTGSTHQDGGGGGSHGGGGDSGGSDSGGDGGDPGSDDRSDPGQKDLRAPLRCPLYLPRYWSVVALADELRAEYIRQLETYTSKDAPDVDENLKYIADLLYEVAAAMPAPGLQERSCITTRPDR